MASKEIFITGLPHCGKSTLLNRVIEDIPQKQGFVTLEIPGDDGQRLGFKIVTAKGSEAVLASSAINTPIRVSRYCVDVESLDRVIPELYEIKPGDVLYIDEIGQMELFSEKFKELIRRFLNSDNIVICTVSKIYSDEFIQSLLSRPNMHLIEVTPENREESYIQIKQLLSQI